MAAPDHKALRLFYTYAHKDERLREKSETALVPLRRQGLIHQRWYKPSDAGSSKEYYGRSLRRACSSLCLRV